MLRADSGCASKELHFSESQYVADNNMFETFALCNRLECRVIIEVWCSTSGQMIWQVDLTSQKAEDGPETIKININPAETINI